jgi:phosphoribosyl 1,2-cyclic phosphodiesterase
MDKLRFQSFGSGSSGNCYFIGNSTQGILIDAGIGVRTIRKCLRDIGLDFDRIWGVFITHNHADHIKSVGALGEKHHIPVYSTRLVHEGIDRSYCMTEKLNGSKKYIEKYESITLGDFAITSFPVSHDSIDSVGYTIEYKGRKFTLATDLGHVDEAVALQIVQSDYILLESNYDEQMLRDGNYPLHLKNRITAPTGHLSNDQAGWFLAENYREHWKQIFLCHLSRENNFPELAYSTVSNYLEAKSISVGKDIELFTLDRFLPSELFELN